jgi:transposase
VPERYGPPTTIYNRFNRWRKAGIWDRLMDAIIAAHDGKVQMIDSTVVRVHQQAAAQKKQAGDACIGRSRGGLTTKLHVRVVGNGLPVQLELSPGQANDAPMAELLLNDLPRGAVVLADRAYDADWIREVIEDQECKACIPPKVNRTEPAPYLRQQYGIILASSTLAKIFSTRSDGPPAFKAGRTPLYPRDGLDTWAASRLGGLRRSTSDAP